MADFEESLQDLQGKQRLYEEQLQQVEEALQQEATEDLQRLQADLNEVILLTKHLIEYKEQQDAQTVEAPEISKNNSASGSRPDAAASHELSAADVPAASAVDAATTRVTAPTSLIGRTCSAEYEGKKYYAIIAEVKRDPKQGERVVVDFIGWGNREEYPLQQVVLLPQAPASDFPPNTAAQAIYSGDGRWYDCSILSVTPFGFRVRFSEYKNEEDIAGDRVRVPRKAVSKKKQKEVVTPGGYRIPQYLAAKPTDTDAQKSSKKRRVKAIKQQQKVEQAEQQLSSSAKSWQQFNKKTVKKTMPGFLTGRGHESIFRGIEVKPQINPTEAAKIVAPAFQPRRKHDFDEGNIPED